jgi:uncharacterized protein
MKDFFLVIIIIFFITSCTKSDYPGVEVKINGKTYSFESAVTEKQRQTGLMFRKKLDKNNGMLFIYGKEEYLFFYMKNTFIPLDIAFIDDEFKIIDIQQMEPLDETTIQSKGKARYALEVNRGFFSKAGLNVGDKLDFTSPIPYKVE